jgi:hypothetical protein
MVNEETLILDDAVQVDKAICALRYYISKLSEENKALLEENTRLKNRPEEQTERKTLLITNPKKRWDLSIDVEEWKEGHFVAYFMVKYKDRYKVNISFRRNSFSLACAAIRAFRNAHSEVRSGADYKAFIDWMFKNKFNAKFVATMYLITNDSMLHTWLTSRPLKEVEQAKKDVKKLEKSNVDIDKLIKEIF